MSRQKFYFWNGALGSEQLLSSYETAVDRLLHGDYASADLEKLTGHDVYSFRLSGTARLLFATHKINEQNYLLLLEDLPTHDYQKSRFLRSGVLQRYRDAQEPAFLAAAAAAAADEPRFVVIQDDMRVAFNTRFQQQEADRGVMPLPLEYFKQQFIQLSEEQKGALGAPMPTLISGEGGSGKSCVAIALIAEHVRKSSQAGAAASARSLLYVCESSKLVDTMLRVWKEHPLANAVPEEIIQFKTYEQLLGDQGLLNAKMVGGEPRRKTIVGRADFDDWYKRYAQTQRKQATVLAKPAVDIAPETVYQEFRICSAYRDNIIYYGLGKRQSLLLGEQRPWLHKAYLDYLGDCEGRDCINPAFCDLPWREQFDLVVVDEAQDLSNLQLLRASELANNRAVVYCMDSHQSLRDKFSKRPYLLEMGCAPVELTTSYRCPIHIARAASAVVKLKQCLAGGLADKHESQGMIAAKSKKNAGHVILLNAQELLSSKEWGSTCKKGPNFAVITRPELRDEARALFNATLIYTPEEIKGLEYNTVAVYQLFDEEVFRKIASRTQEASYSLEQPSNRPGQNAGDDEFSPFLNTIYTSYTRAQATLIICEEESRANKALLMPLRELIAKESASAATASVTVIASDWLAEAIKLRNSGHKTQAADIFEKELQKSPDEFEQFWEQLYPKQATAPVPLQTASASAATPINASHPTVTKPIAKPKRLSPAQDAINALFQHFTKLQLKICLSRPDVNLTMLHTPFAIQENGPKLPFFCHVMQSTKYIERFTQCLATYPDVAKKIATIEFFNEILKQGKDANLVGTRVEGMLLALLGQPHDDMRLFKKREVKAMLSKMSISIAQSLLHWLTLNQNGLAILKQWIGVYPDIIANIYAEAWGHVQLTAIDDNNQRISAFHWLTLTDGGFDLLHQLCSIKPKFLSNMPPEAWAYHQTAAAGSLENTSPLYSFTSNPKGRFFLQEQCRANPNFLNNIPAEAWTRHRTAAAGSLENISPLYCFIASIEGRALLQELCSANPNFLSNIPAEAWARHRTAEAGSHENTSPLYYLVAEPEGRVLLKQLCRINPNFLSDIPAEAWARHRTAAARANENTSPLYFLVAEPEGRALLQQQCHANPNFLSNVPAEAWVRHRTAAAGAFENTAPLYFLTSKPEGRALLQQLCSANPNFLCDIPAEAWARHQTAAAGSYENTSPLYFLTFFPEGRTFLQQQCRANPNFLSNVPAEAWGRHRTAAAGALENTSPLYFLTAKPGGRPLLQQLCSANPTLLSNIPAEAWVRHRTEAAGADENTSPLFFLTSNPEGRALLEQLCRANPSFLSNVPVEAWARHLTAANVAFENSSPLYFLTSKPEGRALLQQLWRENPQFISNIPAETWARHLTAAAGPYENTSPLYFLTSKPEGRDLLQQLCRANPQFLSNIPAEAWVRHRTAAARADENTSPLYFLTSCSEGRELLQQLCSANPKLLSNIPAEAWARHRTAAAEADENTSPLYFLPAYPEGCELLQQLCSANPNFLTDIPAEAWARHRTKAAGANENTSPLYFFTSKPEGRALLQQQCSANPKFLSDIPAEAWARHQTAAAAAFENASPLFYLTSNPDGHALLQQLCSANPKFLSSIPGEAWARPLTAAAGVLGNIIPLMLLASTPQGNTLMEQVCATHSNFLNNIPAETWTRIETAADAFAEKIVSLGLPASTPEDCALLQQACTINPNFLSDDPEEHKLLIQTINPERHNKNLALTEAEHSNDMNLSRISQAFFQPQADSMQDGCPLTDINLAGSLYVNGNMP